MTRQCDQKELHPLLAHNLKILSVIGTEQWKNVQKEEICGNLELTFFLKPWWNRDYNFRRPLASSRTSYKAGIRNEDKISEDGLLINLGKVLDNIRKREYVSAQPVIRILWEIINNYKKRPEFDGRDRSHDLIVDLENVIHEMNQNKTLKNSLRLCCTACRLLPLRATACKGKNCLLMIEINSVCYNFSDGSSDMWKSMVCQKCYEKASDDYIEVRKRKLNVIQVEWKLDILPRHIFKKMVLTPEVFEEWERDVECLFCENSYHPACVMHDDFNLSKFVARVDPKFSDFFKIKYICDFCIRNLAETNLHKFNFLNQSDKVPPEIPIDTNMFTENSLVHTQLSQFMECELQKYIFKECNIMHEGLPPDFKVRVMCSRKKVFEAKPRMKLEFEKIRKPSKWEYEYKSIMVFQLDPELRKYFAVFNMIVHEYPERGSVNISYIDSVKLFQPSKYRSDFYKRVLFTYLQFLQKNPAYKRLHIWVCPPTHGDEYVFYGRPRSDTDHRSRANCFGLINWYKVTIENSLRAGVIVKYIQIGPEHNPYETVTDIPYMADDFWVQRLEQLLHEHEKELKAWNMLREGKKYCATKAPPSLNERLADVVLHECRNLLFTAEFNSNHDLKFDDKNEVDDNKPHVEYESDIFSVYMSSRDNFLVDCRENKLDFSNRRRAAYSTMTLFSKIAQESLSLKCKECTTPIRKGVYCVECDNIVFCSPECGRRHNIHGLNPKLYKFRVPLDDRMPNWLPIRDDGMSNIYPIIIGKLISKLINEETSSLYGIKSVLESLCRTKNGRMDLCNLLMLRMLSPGYEHNDANEKHRRNCKTCDLVWVAVCRHKKICLVANCILGCPAAGKRPLENKANKDQLKLLPSDSAHLTHSMIFERMILDKSWSSSDANGRKRKIDGTFVEPNSTKNIPPAINRPQTRCLIKPSEVVLEYHAEGSPEVVSSNGHRLLIQNNSILMDDSLPVENSNRFLPLVNYTSPSTALSSQSPFTDSLQGFSNFRSNSNNSNINNNNVPKRK